MIKAPWPTVALLRLRPTRPHASTLSVAPLVEEGIPIDSRALSGLIDYSQLFSYEELSFRLSGLK